MTDRPDGPADEQQNQQPNPATDGADPRSVLSGLVSDWFSADVGADVIRTFSEVNRRGFEAAGDLISKMTEVVDGVSGRGHSRPAGPVRTNGAGAADESTSASMRREVLTSIDMWADMMGSLVESSFELLRRDGTSTSTEAAAPAAVLGPLRPGGTTSLPLYARAMAGQGLIRCRVGGFESANGSMLESGSVSVHPDVLIEGSNEQLTVRVDLADSVAPGRYHGFVFADGVTDAAIAVEITVVEP